ncbi:hypothetical protein [Tersicoccus solisilvae]|uniref:hypothetical protein n=1 Tax=Tersicoccus solisilvae TaxID=1882339 RepID=UPI00166DD536|nr:hypothetical protein [Tersicoccus solisilvae]
MESGVLRRVRRGWYIADERWQRLSPEHRYLVRVYAVGLPLPASTTVSHQSAAVLSGLDLLAIPADVHLRPATQHGGRGPRSGIVHHRSPVRLSDARTIQGVRVTGPEDLVRDTAATLTHRGALVIADQVAAQGLDTDALRSWIAENPGRPGVRRLARVLDRLDPASESAGETLTRVLLHEWAVPLPISQYWITTAIGDHRVDFAWPDRRLVLEFDGRGKYFDYRPTAEALYEERRREKALVNAGWRVIRIGWPDVTGRSDALRRLLLTALAAAAA